jgi:hypothetical protein
MAVNTRGCFQIFDYQLFVKFGYWRNAVTIYMDSCYTQQQPFSLSFIPLRVLLYLLSRELV